MWDGHIAMGDVDERSIEDVRPVELAGYTQCHFFAGIGGWSYALRLAEWPDDRPVWTGSCPCQPFSAAGKGKGFADERHLWPAFGYLISQLCPAVVFGEQVASRAGLDWLDTVSHDLERAGYGFGAADLCAAGVGAPHIRQRLYWVADSVRDGLQVGFPNTSIRTPAQQPPSGSSLAGSRRAPLEQVGVWNEPRVLPLVDGVSPNVGLLRGYGNAIVPQVAAAFIEAYLAA